jgi:putative inorganic carbon (hco3(-)) transporter
VAAIVVILILLANVVVALVSPWRGFVLAYVIAIFAPQDVWWWAFEGVRPFYWIIVPALIGFGVAVLRGQVAFAQLNTRLNRCMFLLWLCFTISYYFGPYVDVFNAYRFYDPAFMFATLQKTFLTYFVATTLIDSPKKLKVMALVMVVTAVYMTYWANMQYFVYHVHGRLHGPTTLSGAGIYSDENNFALLFVVGFPFIYFLGQYLNRKVVIWLTWLVIPFSWHAVFLTASRGALLGIGAVLLAFVWRLQKKTMGLLLIGCFVAAFVWEAGDLMKNRSATITSYEQEDSASFRIEAWKASIGMMKAHPLTGVGFSSFGQAFPDFSTTPPRVAHNTFFQIGGEWGVVAGFTYLFLIFSTVNRLRKNGSKLRSLAPTDDGRIYYVLNESCLLALIGFFVCSMFLSLQGYEVFYYLLMLANATLVGSGKLLQEKEPQAAPRGRGYPQLVQRPATLRRG